MVKKEEFPKKKWKKWVNKLYEQYSGEFYTFLDQKRAVFKLEISELYDVIIDEEQKEPLLIIRRKDEKIIPTLQILRKFTNLLPKIWVDMGAIKFLLNGANLFRPGITKFESFEKNQLVQVLNPQENVLCIGETLFSSSTMPDKGVVLHTITYLNDELWRSMDLLKE